MSRIPKYYKHGMWQDVDLNTGEMVGVINTLTVFEDYTKDNLYYSFQADNAHHHAHEFESVLKACFDYPDTFCLTEEDKVYYSEQELYFLDKLQRQCLKDDMHDITINNKYIIEELKKRNYQHLIDIIKEDN